MPRTAGFKFGPLSFSLRNSPSSAVILYLAWFLDLKRRTPRQMEFCKDNFMHTILPAAATDSCLRRR